MIATQHRLGITDDLAEDDVQAQLRQDSTA